MQSWELIAHGRVQGVGFRWHVQRCALMHNIKGYVRNEADGTVMILAQAEAKEIDIFCDCVRYQSSSATVLRLEINKIEPTKRYNGFEIR